MMAVLSGIKTDERSRVVGEDTREGGDEPVKLHTREPERLERLGGLQYTRRFEKQINRAIKDAHQAWWNDPYLAGCIARQLGPEALEAVLAVTRDGEAYPAVAQRYLKRHPWEWLGVKQRQAQRIAWRLRKVEMDA